MSEWGDEVVVSDRRPASGGWHWALTLLALLLVGALSILMAYVTRNIINRPFWMMGLVFAVPAGAMFFSAMLMEFGMSAMTPRESRGKQVKVAVIATLLTFVIGCLCDGIYLYGGFFTDTGIDYVFVLDRGDTMAWEWNGDTQAATQGERLEMEAERIIAGMPKMTNAGLVTFDSEVISAVPIDRLSDTQRQVIRSALPVYSSEPSGISFAAGIDEALDLIERKNSGRPTRIVVITYGQEARYVLSDDGEMLREISQDASVRGSFLMDNGRAQSIIQRCSALNASVYCVISTGDVDASLINVINATGGQSIALQDAPNAEALQVDISMLDGDMIRADSVASIVLTGVMLLLEGIVIGGGLFLLLSVANQKRFQIILSPLMAIVAFVVLKIVFRGQYTWVIEGVSFSLLGIVLMRKNVLRGSGAVRPVAGGDDWGGSDTGFGGSNGSDFGADDGGFGGGSNDGGFDSGSNDQW